MNEQYWRFIELNMTKLAESNAKLFHTPLYASINTWNNNYWRDYNGSGSYVVDENNVDQYPRSQPVDISKIVDINSVAPTATTEIPVDNATINSIITLFVALAVLATIVIGSLLLFRRHRKPLF